MPRSTRDCRCVRAQLFQEISHCLAVGANIRKRAKTFRSASGMRKYEHGGREGGGGGRKAEGKGGGRGGGKGGNGRGSGDVR
eukprot:4039901-Pyramimonas_sp.AAC.1